MAREAEKCLRSIPWITGCSYVLLVLSLAGFVKADDTLQEKMEEMQGYIGDKPVVHRETFSNWDGTTVVQDVLVVAPTNLNEIQRCVKAVAKVGLKMRCVGKAHTYANLFADEGQVVIETQYLKERHDGPPIELNNAIWRNNLTIVTAAAGLTQEDLVQFFIHNGVQMKAASHEMGALVGGLFSTGSRGEDFKHGPMSEEIVATRFVDSAGELRSLNVFQHPHEMPALKLCVGMCGVIYDISFLVTPLEVAARRNEFPSQKDVVFNTTHLRELHDKFSAQMYWSPLSSLTDAQWSEYDVTGKITRDYDPMNDIVWLRTIEAPIHGVTPDSRYIIGNEVPQMVQRRAAEDTFPDGTLGLPQKRVDGTTVWHVTREIFDDNDDDDDGDDDGDDDDDDDGGGDDDENEDEDEDEEPTGTGGFSLRYHQFALAYTKATEPAEYFAYLPEVIVSMNASARDVIYAVQWDFPDDKDFSVMVDVLTVTLHRLAEYAYQGQMPVLTMIYKWHQKSPDCFLCPGDLTRNDTQIYYTFSLELVGAPNDPLYPKFVREMTSVWGHRWPTSTPCWAKWYKYIPGISRYFKSSFGASLDAFVDVLKDLNVDPDHMFTNKILEDIFYKKKP